MSRSLTIPTQPVSQLCSGNLITVREISIAGTIDAYSGALLDERGHSSARGPGMGRKPGPLNEREFSSI